MWPEFFLQTLLGLVINEVWDFTVDKIKKVYKEHKDMPEDQKTFQSRMYTAIIDAFCEYTGVNPDEAQDDAMDFICHTAKEYFDQSYKNQDTTTDALLSAIKTLESRFDNTLLEKKNTEDINKILFISDYIQRYIAKDQEFRHIYVVEALEYLRCIGVQIKENQLDLKLFAEEAINKAEHRLAVLIGLNSDRVIDEIKQDNREQTKVILAAIDKSSQHGNKEKKIFQSDEKSEFKDVKTEYVDKWNERLFLHRRPEDEELTLRNTYIPTLYETIIPESDRTNEPQDDLNIKLEQFIKYGKSLLIIGAPGIGKTSIVCNLADKYKNNSDVIILRFSDWSEDEWVDLAYKTHGSLLAKAITHRLGCTEKNLKNKLLILDGFDEIKYYSRSNDLLKSFLLQIRNIRGLRVLITSRDNYIKLDEVKFQQVIKLCPFNGTKIIQFCKKIIPTFEIDDENMLFIDKEVYGIPVILYMAIVSGIDITQNSSRCNTYNKIFSYEGGIFDRFATISTEGYDDSSTHDISYEKEAFINILRKTAFTMFRVSNDNSITIEKYQEIIDAESQKVVNKTALWYDFPIDNLYEKNNRLQFVHKSIYEYFVAENIYYQLLKLFRSTNNKIQNDGFSIIADLLCANIFEDDIIEFMRYRIRNSELNTLEVFEKLKYLLYTLLNFGPTNFITNDGCEKPPFHLENYGKFLCNINIIFHNLLVLIHCWTTTKNFKDIPLNKLAIDHKTSKHEYDSFVNLIISYLNHIDDCNKLDLSYMGFYSGFEVHNLPYFEKFIKRNNLLLLGLIKVENKFSFLQLKSNNLSNSAFINIDFTYSKIIESSFANTLLHICFIYKTEFINSNFNSSELINVTMENTSFYKGLFAPTDMIDCYFKNCYFNTEFRIDNCSGKNTFINCTFDHIILSGDFEYCDFINCHFNAVHSSKYLTSKYMFTHFIDSVFSDDCILTNSIFTGAEFRDTDRSGATFDKGALDEAIIID